MPTRVPLDRLQLVPLREAWQNEAGDFTPWLAQPENIALLAETLNLQLELVAVEQHVGPFRADIVCRNLDAPGEPLVLIENQLEGTDHKHLGQLMTYAAGLDAATVIWVAEEFEAEHRGALDWLNRITPEGIDFYGLEIQLYRIANSPAAPRFNVVCAPNEATRRAKRRIAQGASPRDEGRFEYFEALKAALAAAKSPLKSATFNQRRLRFGIGGRCDVRAVADNDSIRAQLTLDGDNAPALFAMLQHRRAEFEAAVGEPLQWFEDEGKKRRRVLISIAANSQDRADWPRQHQWLREKMELLYRVFEPALSALPFQAPGGVTAGV